MKKKAAPRIKTRTLLVKEENGNFFKVTIPEDYKVTFGPIFTRKREGKYSGYNEPVGSAIRIYEAGDKQRAVFTGIASFRDLSLPLERLVILKSGESSWNTDELDGSKSSTEVKVTQKTVKEEF